MPQYTLPFNLPTHYSEENFYISACNQVALRQVKSWPTWQALFLFGSVGCGKTHLGHIWANLANAQIIHCNDTALEPDTLTRHTLIENIESAEETCVFHAINLSKERGFSLLLTASAPVKQLGFSLPDLTSRLTAMPAACIEKPDDDVLIGALRKQFADRQIGASEEVLRYLLNHNERSFSAIHSAVTMLDKAMWQEKKSLTIPFIRKILAEHSAA